MIFTNNGSIKWEKKIQKKNSTDKPRDRLLSCDPIVQVLLIYIIKQSLPSKYIF